jgi:hypothetical protein
LGRERAFEDGDGGVDGACMSFPPLSLFLSFVGLMGSLALSTLLSTLASTLSILRSTSLGAVPSVPQRRLNEGEGEGGEGKRMRDVEVVEREVGRLFREKQAGREGSEIVLSILGVGN